MAWPRSSSEDGRQRGLQDDDRVEVRGLAAGLDAPRLGLVHRGDGLDPEARGVLQRVDGALEGLQAVAEVASRGRSRPVSGCAGWCRPRPPARTTEAGTGCTVGSLACGAGGHARLRVMVMVTSSKGTVIGASGLWTTTSTSWTASCFRHGCGDALGERLDQVDGLALDDGDDLLRHDAVVHGLRQVVVGRRRAGVQAEHQVHDEGLALLALLREHTVVPAGLEAAQRDTIHANHSCSRRSGWSVPRAGGTPASHRIYLRALTGSATGRGAD